MTAREQKAAEMQRVYNLGIKYVSRLEKVVNYKALTPAKTAQQLKLILCFTILVRRAQWQLAVIEGNAISTKTPKRRN